MAAYKDAIEWIAGNDDCYWIGDRDAHGPIMSVTACMVRDLWNKPEVQVIKDIKKSLIKIYPDHEALKGG